MEQEFLRKFAKSKQTATFAGRILERPKEGNLTQLRDVYYYSNNKRKK